MLKRTLTGACFVAVVVGFFLLKELVDSRLFSILIWFCCGMGTFELARAVKKYTGKKTFILSVVYGIIFVPAYAITEYFICVGYGIFAVLILTLLTLIINAIFCHVENGNIKDFLVKGLGVIYPSWLFLTMLIIAGMSGAKSLIGLLLIFVISPLTDTLAYLVGMIYNKIKKGTAKKLCPRLSPKKTWAGAIGGTIGGILGGILIFLIFRSRCISLFPLPLLILTVIGFVGAILTQIGDLFESGIKRKVGIKDMGKIMPGHGGILDRFDGMMFTSVIICLIFLII